MFPETLICLVKRTQLGLLFALCKKNDYEKITCYFSLSLTLFLFSLFGECRINGQ